MNIEGLTYKMRIIEIINRKLISPLFKKYAYIEEELIATSILHKETFLPYKNLCNGEKDVVVCGAGPTLNKYKPIEGAIHIAVNRAFLFDKVDFDFIFAQDFEGINMVEEQLINYRKGKCIKFLGTQPFSNPKKVIPVFILIIPLLGLIVSLSFLNSNSINFQTSFSLSFEVSSIKKSSIYLI